MSGDLQVSDLSAGYDDLTVLREITLTIAQGSLTGILGRNGAGKSTLLRALAGLNKATTGRIEYAGADITRVKPHRRVDLGIAYVQEGKRVFRELSVEDNLIVGGHRGGLSRRKLEEQIGVALERFPVLAARRSEPAGALSGGQQQMLAIAQALIPEPKVILLDEPSAGLAPALIADVFHTIEQLRVDGLTIALVEQSLDYVVREAAHVYVLDLGRVVFDGDPRAAGARGAIESSYFSRQSA
jgi:branched-chain amino acid transport system ATP-binding protein